MNKFKLEIDLLPKGAWNNDFSKTLSKKDWDTLRELCYKRANGFCQICGAKTDDLDAHEMWDFDVENQTQTLKNIVAVCSKCHGVIHFKNSVRLGFGNDAKKHFIKVNNCSEMDFAAHLHRALAEYEARNKIYRWKMIADLEKFGGKDIEIKPRDIPKIINPYDGIQLEKLNYNDKKQLFTISKTNTLIGAPKILSIDVDNYQGIITICSLFTNKIEWFLDDIKIKTKYNVVGKFKTPFSVENLKGNNLYFKLINQDGYVISQNFKLDSF